MATKWIGSTLCLLCCCLLASGCATRIQKSLDRSMMIAKRCADIEEAVPNRKEVESELINAIAMRLIATCSDGTQSCLGSASGRVPPNPVTASEKLLTNLQQHRAILVLNNQQFLHANKDEVASLQMKQEELQLKLFQQKGIIVEARGALYDEFKNARIVLRDSLSKARACDRRTSCIAALGRHLSTVREKLDGKVADLRQKVRDLQLLAQSAQGLAQDIASFLDRFSVSLTATAATTRHTIHAAGDQLTRDTATLVASSDFLAQRLDAGARVLDSLFSAEFQDAATDLMMARLYDKVADKTMAGIDRVLSQVDRTIDKVDEHVYGAATLGAYMFEDEMQNKFDQVFTTYIADRLPNSNTAKLAFAAAACKHLAPDDDNGARNASLFSPFVFATLIRIQVDLEGGTRTPESVRKEWEQSLGKTDSQSAETEQKSDTVFLGLVAEAYYADSSTNTSKAPSILQQVALCANVEQQLASIQQLNTAALKERTWAACGNAVMSATLMGYGLPGATDPVLAQHAIEKAPLPPPASAPPGQPSAEDAAAWRRAMEAVLAASVPKQPSHLERLCQRIISDVRAVRCEPTGSGHAVTLQFDSSFAIGKAEDRKLEMQIARLADILAEDKRTYAFTVFGHASASTFPCARVSTGMPTSCGAEKNHALAKARADWAMAVLRRRLQERMVADIQAVGLFNPLSFDTRDDRRIRMTVSMRN